MVYVSSLLVRLMNRVGLLSSLRVGYTLKVLNQTFKIPVIEEKAGLLFHHSVGEPYLLEIFQKLYSKRDFVFLDAGVNFGQTLLKVKAVNPGVTYIGFEPSGLCSYYTSQLIKVNKMVDATLIKCALSNSTGVLTLHSETEGDTRASIIESTTLSENKYQEIVPVITLDSLIPTLIPSQKSFLLKIDVEGAEWMVLEGSEKLIDSSRPVVVFENLPYRDNNNKHQQQQFISKFFVDKGFDLYLMDEHKHSLSKINSIDNRDDYSKTNYLVIPSEQSKELVGE